MDRLADKAQRKITKLLNKFGAPGDNKESNIIPLEIDGPISTRVVYSFRKQRGVNLGSWFTLERWISDAPFRQAQHPSQSDYDVAKGPNAKEILEKHWETWITEDDWMWLSEHGINTVRIPIGFYHVCGADNSVLDGTDFADLGHVFSGAWSRILFAIDSAAKHGIGVLIDLHAAPGKQNADAHSGQTGPIRFFERANLARTQHILCILAKELYGKDNVVGLQLLNEPQGHRALTDWYVSTLNEIRQIAPALPLYIHDAWDTHKYTSLAGGRAESDFVAVDYHLYRCFTAADHKLSGDEHAGALRAHMSGELAARAGECRGNLIVGEFSAALNPASMRSGEPGEQDRQRRVFARAELELFERQCAGWFFWTYKKDGWDAGWSLRDTVVAEIMPAWHGVRRILGKMIVNDPAKRDVAKDKALHDHSTYWDQQKGHYEHWRFEDGFIEGWEDAYTFFSFDLGSAVPELGFKGQWAKRRAHAHSKEKGHSKNIWEFEHGFSQGVDAAKTAFLGSY
ncbi:glycoside hydrolase [Phellopilus nigrolimitatus]|nr:glycoside hydrolase [Phellopilus nigrolimitatus]